MVKDHVVLLNEDSATPLAWRVNASFAGYLAGKMATLVSDPEAVHDLERRLDGCDLMQEARALFRDMVRTARRRQEDLHVTA